MLGINQRSLTFLRAEKFCLRFGLGKAYFRGGKEFACETDEGNYSASIAWNDKLEDMRMVQLELAQMAARYPRQSYWKQFERYHSSVLNREIKKLTEIPSEN